LRRLPRGPVDSDEAHVGLRNHPHLVAAVQPFPLADHVARPALVVAGRRLDDQHALEHEQQPVPRLVRIDDDMTRREGELRPDVEQFRDEVLVDC
jgi:hypothetical protein